MRLIHTKTFQLEEFYGQPPEYAIISHTWGPEEATFQDWHGNLELMKLRKGHQKIRRVCEQARKDGLMHRQELLV
jgi:hypothetical protein